MLRIAIGWHFLSEGLYKIMSTPEGKESSIARTLNIKPTEGPAFSSEGYQRNATGPFAANFRAIVPDVDSREALDFSRLKDAWSGEMNRIGDHFGFGDDQRSKAAKELSDREKVAQVWFEDPENREKIKQYLDGLDSLARDAARRNRMSYEVERTLDARKSLDKDRRSLVAPIDAWSKALRDAWVGLASPEQLKDRGAYAPPWSQLKQADYTTMYGLAICGLALMIGLFTPIAALGGATFLMLFYLSMPPWPGLPEPANAEGHYVLVNKNLIEFFACLALAATPSGLWLGIDAFLFGWIDRLRARRALKRLERDEAALASHEVRVNVPRPSKTR